MKYFLSLILIFICSNLYAQAVGVPKNHNQLAGTGTNSHATIDTFIASKGQASGLASLDASGNVIQPTGTATGFVKQTNGTASGTVLTSASIVSGTGTLSNANLPGTVTLSTLYGTDTIEINPVNRINFKINGNIVGGLTSTGLALGGTHSPAYALDIIGTTAMTGNLINATVGSYHYFGGSAYGLRDNNGTMQFKNSSGSWGDIASSTSGGGWQDDGLIIRPITATDQVVIGSTTSSNRQLTNVGSSTLYGQVAIGSNTTVIGGLNNTLLDVIIGDSDTGLKWIQDGDLGLYGNGNQLLVIDGNNNQIRIATTTAGTKLNIGGTATAEGFSGNGNGLTNISDNALSAEVRGTTTSVAAYNVKMNANGGINVGTINTFGTTTQWNSSAVTIYGSGTSPISVVVNRNYIGTNTTSIMTGTSTPAGEVLVSSTYSGNYHGYEAFDGVISGSAGNGWSATGATNESITYNYGTGAAHGLKQYRITANITDISGANNAPNTFDLRGSNDNVTYTSIDARSGEGTWTALETKTYTIATSTMQYQFYRLHISTINGGANTTIGELQLIGEAGLFDSLYVNGSGTVLLGTTTASSTSTTYLLQVGGGILGTNLGVTCYKSIKSIIGSGSSVIKEGYDAVMGTKLFKHHPRIGDNIDTSVTSITPVSDDPSTSDLFKRGDTRILDLQPQIGALMGTVQYQDAVIKDLESRLQILETKN